MALKNLFDMVKADRYTQDGREAIIKAQEAETEDATRRTYQIGEISEATGLQKTAQGWKPPKETKFGKVKQNKEGQWGVQTKQGKGSDFLKHKSEKEASRALANYTAGYNTTERSKQDPHSDQARQQKQWNKETDRMRKNSNAERRAEHASQFAKKVKPGSVIQNAREQSESFKMQRADYLEAFHNETNEERKEILSSLVFNAGKQKSMYEGIADYNDSYGGWKINNSTANKLHDLQEEQMRLEAKLDKMKNEPGPDRDDSPERAAYERELSRQQAQRAADDPRGFGYEEPPMEPAAPRREAVSAGRMMKDLDGNFWSRPEDFKEDITSRGWDVEEMTNEYAVISNEAGSQYEVRFDDHSDDGDLTVRTFKALQIDEDDEDDSLEEDAAPKIRQLTGDCKIRVRKA